MSRTFIVAGVKVRSSSQRRYVAFIVRRDFDGVRYTDTVKDVSIFKRSDSVATLKTHIQRLGFHQSQHFVIVDQTTGEEVA